MTTPSILILPLGSQLPPHYIYIMGADRAGPLKIGLSASPEERIKAFRGLNPYPLELYWTALCPNPRWERVMHRALAPWRLEGEWFDVPLEKAISAYLHVYHFDVGAGESELEDIQSDSWAEIMGWPGQEAAA